MTSRLNRLGRDLLGPLVVFVVFLIAWYIVSTIVLPEEKRFLLPTPHRVISDGFGVWHAGDDRGLYPILVSLWDSAKMALLGLFISIVLGTSLATAMSLRPWFERATWPYLVAIQSAPILALTPLIRALIDGATAQRLFVVVLISIFPIVSNTLFGLLSAESGQHDLFTLQGASKAQRLAKLQFPASLPNVFLGLRISSGLAVIGAVVGDFYFRQGGQVGIGAQIDIYRQRLWGPELIASIILASLLGLIVFLSVGWLGHRIIGKWHRPTRGS